MRIRLVIDLQYPTASSQEHEELIKHRLSAQVLAAARTKQFNVLALDEQETIKVEEIMVGCARVEDRAPAIGPGCVPMQTEKVDSVATQTVDPGLPEQRPDSIPVGADPNVYGDEDGDYWFASGHLEVHKMVDAVIAWESEVADPIDSRDINMGSHKTYYVIEDPENPEMYRVVNGDSVGAQPMTSIRRA